MGDRRKSGSAQARFQLTGSRRQLSLRYRGVVAMSLYIIVKFIHVLVAVVAVGASAGSSLWLRLAMRSPAHLPFALRTAKVLDERLTRPGLIVLLMVAWQARLPCR